MSLRLGMPVVMVAALSISLVAQTRPNLAGKWEQVYEKSTPVRPAPTPPFPPTTISQDANTITISYVAYTPALGATATFNSTTGQVTGTQLQQNQGTREDFPYTLTYVCDDAEHPEPAKVPPLPAAPTPTPSRPGGTVSVMSYSNPTYRATWTGGQLVVTTRAVSTIDPPPANYVLRARVIRKTYSIDADGFLSVETLTTYDPATTGQPPTPTRAVYRKIS